MRESDIQKLTMVALTKNGCKVFRANAGKFLSLDGQHVIQGLPNGFFDLKRAAKAIADMRWEQYKNDKENR